MSLKAFINNNQEYRVVAGLLIVLLSVELTVRLSEDHLSGNVSHVFSIPAIIDEVDNNKNNSLIFIGNSLTNRGIDSSTIDEILNNKISASLYQSFKIIPDNTGIAEWYCIYQNQIRQLQKPPKFIIVGFAWDQVSDQSLINPARLGGFFCKIDDIQPLSVTELSHHVKQLQFYAGIISHVYVGREAIRNRIFAPNIPNYLVFTRRINENNNQSAQPLDDSQMLYTHELLADLVENIRAAGSDIILIAMPVKQSYEIHESLVATTRELRIPLLDMRNTGFIASDMFMDPIHLNPDGRKILSKLIAQELSNFLKLNVPTDTSGMIPNHIRK